MNLVDLMEIWALQNNGREPMELLMEASVDERIDKKLLMEQIVVKCSGLTPVFNTSWSFVTWHRHWFDFNKEQIKELIDTTKYDYIPIESYSRYEDMKHNAGEGTTTTDNNSSNKNVTVTDSNNGNKNITVSDSSTMTDSDENKTSAYNESLYQPESRRDGQSSETKNGSTQEINSETKNGSTQENNSEERTYKKDRNFNSKDDNYVHGNNGLFTVQHLIEEQRRLVTFNVMDWIVKKYMKDGFLLVY